MHAYIYTEIFQCKHLDVIIMRTSCILYCLSLFSYLSIYNSIHTIITCEYLNKRIIVYI